MIKAAIFDMDGTLTDTERVFRDTWMELPQEYGMVANPDFPRAVCGSNGESMLKIIHTYYPDVDAKVFKEHCFRVVAEKNEKHLPLKEGALEIVQIMKDRGFRLAVASSNFNASITNNLEKTGLLPYFDVVLGGDDVEKPKPFPDVYIKAAQMMGCKPEECYAFEDGINGLRSALASGCETYMVVDLTEPDEVYAPQCKAVYSSLTEVIKDLL